MLKIPTFSSKTMIFNENPCIFDCRRLRPCPALYVAPDAAEIRLNFTKINKKNVENDICTDSNTIIRSYAYLRLHSALRTIQKKIFFEIFYDFLSKIINFHQILACPRKNHQIFGGGPGSVSTFAHYNGRPAVAQIRLLPTNRFRKCTKGPT